MSKLCECHGERTCPNSTPRVARTEADLRAGQVVAWCENGQWDVATYRPEEWDYVGTEVILFEPPPEPVEVPRHLYDRMVKAWDENARMNGNASLQTLENAQGPSRDLDLSGLVGIRDAVRDLTIAVEKQ